MLAVQARREFALDFEQEIVQFAIVGIAVADGRDPPQGFRLDPQPGFLGELSRQGSGGRLATVNPAAEQVPGAAVIDGL